MYYSSALTSTQVSNVLFTFKPFLIDHRDGASGLLNLTPHHDFSSSSGGRRKEEQEAARADSQPGVLSRLRSPSQTSLSSTSRLSNVISVFSLLVVDHPGFRF